MAGTAGHWDGTPQRLARTALGLGLGAAATVIVFWTGWPLVLGAVATVLGLEHRRRVGSFAPAAITATALGCLALDRERQHHGLGP